MQVEIWSDFVCPFCFIGKRRFEEALAEFEHRDAVQVAFRAFELDPDRPRDGNPPVTELLIAKYGRSREQVEANLASLTEQARQAGLDYRLAEAVQTNTFDAHRLAILAGQSGRAEAMAERLFRAHFTEAQHIGDSAILAELAAGAGLDRDRVLAVLAGADFSDEVRAEEAEAARLGIRGVPFFVLDGRLGVSGAQPAEVFRQALAEAWAGSS